MTPDQTLLEAELRELHAASLDEELLLRLEAAAEGTLTELGHGELRLEKLLRDASPTRLPAEFLSALESVLQGAPFPVDEKIVLFPKANVSLKFARKRPTWAAAAAVALIGAATALLVPVNTPTGETTARSGSPAFPKTSADNFIPASFNRGVRNVSDEGVVWKNDNQPHQLMRVEYVDKITLKDRNGRTYQAEQPRFRYMLVPARTD
jgi:hypothetical protein